MTTNNAAQDRQDIENLLPWFATGTLNRRDAQRVEQALASDAELNTRLELVREELAGTIEVNETLGAPSSKAMSRLFAAIDAEPKRTHAVRFSLSGWLSERIESLTPRTLAFGAVAGALALMLQAGLVATLYVGQRNAEARYEMASAQISPENREGSFAMVGFNPSANQGEITKFLEGRKLTVVDGPRANGLYRIRVSGAELSKDEAAKTIAALRQEAALVRFIVPVE